MYMVWSFCSLSAMSLLVIWQGWCLQAHDVSEFAARIWLLDLYRAIWKLFNHLAPCSHDLPVPVPAIAHVFWRCHGVEVWLLSPSGCQSSPSSRMKKDFLCLAKSEWRWKKKRREGRKRAKIWRIKGQGGKQLKVKRAKEMAKKHQDGRNRSLDLSCFSQSWSFVDLLILEGVWSHMDRLLRVQQWMTDKV